MYLKNGLNLKELFTFFCIFLSSILISDLYVNRSTALIFIGMFIFYIVRVIYQAFTEGFFILLDQCDIEGKTYHVRDFIFLKNLNKSYREIFIINNPTIVSRSLLFKKNKQEIEFLNIIKYLTGDLFFKKILLLGGAGCSLASYLIDNRRGKKIDVIEYNPTMIRWARKYFLKDGDGINLIHGDGLKFSKLAAGFYDLIIIDMFEDHRHIKGIAERSFIKDVHSVLGKEGVFILNLGLTLQFEKIVKSWQEFFPLYIYLSSANLFISNIKFDSFESDLRNRFLFKIPQLSVKSK